MPPLHLTEVNFQALYEQRLAELQQQQGAANGNGNGSDSGIILPASATRQ
ncbi:MAG: protein-export chaperone SecB, partial [Achromobacter piechaudii]